MGRATLIRKGLLERAGPPKDTAAGFPGWTASQLAWAIGCSEQTVCTWSRQGRILPPVVTTLGLRFAASAIAALELEGVGKLGRYRPVTKGEIRRLKRFGRPVPVAVLRYEKGAQK